MALESTNIFHLLFRITSIFMVLLILTRILGKNQMSHLTFFNYITGITIGSIAANMVHESNQPFIDDFISLTWWCILTLLVGFISLKSGKLRQIIDGQPTIVIKKGKIIKDSLKSNRVNMDDLSMLLRKQNIFSIKEVDYAILEPNGNLSVIKKPQHQQITKSDINIYPSPLNYIPSEIIVDGKIIYDNLKELNLNEHWLQNELKKQNITSAKDVFYAEIQTDGSLFINKN